MCAVRERVCRGRKRVLEEVDEGSGQADRCSVESQVRSVLPEIQKSGSSIGHECSLCLRMVRL